MTKKNKISFVTLEELDRKLFVNKPENVLAFLNVALAEYRRDGNRRAFLDALALVAKWVGVSKIAQKSGMTRQGVYKAIKPGSRPSFLTVLDLLQSAGFTFKVNKS